MTRDGRVVGRHDGVIYYTLGQRRGLGLGGVKGAADARWFVIDKDVERNILYVDQGEADALYSKALRTSAFNYISERPEGSFECCAKFRYRQGDQRVRVTAIPGGERIEFEKRQRAVTPGQYAVLYMGDECLGGRRDRGSLFLGGKPWYITHPVKKKLLF